MKSILLAVLAVAVLLSFVPLEQSQAQLVINIYPSQDSPTTQTIWIFSGSSTTTQGSSIRTSSGSNTLNGGDAWFFTSPNSGNFYNANGPSRSTFSLSPLLSSTNTTDIESVRARIPGGGRTQKILDAILNDSSRHSSLAKTVQTNARAIQYD